MQSQLFDDRHDKKQKPSTQALVQKLKNEDADFEWYPSTKEQLAIIRADLELVREETHGLYAKTPAVLDCGAGDGRALEALTDGDKYAIEKSRPLIQAMDRSIRIVGTVFEENTLIDKKVDVVFSNPPYSSYVQWMTKIIKEANADLLYFIVPDRWTENRAITEAIKLREGEVSVIARSDFYRAERAARAKVHIVKIDISYKSRYRKGARKDPFNIWFEEYFDFEIGKKDATKFKYDEDGACSRDEAITNGVVKSGDLVKTMVTIYQKELEKLMTNYHKLQSIDAGLMAELNVDIETLKSSLRLRCEGLKDAYWRRLFEGLQQITRRLCKAQRAKMLDQLTAHTHIDFTVSNCYAVVIWACKNANKYYDDQLIELVERMVEKANIKLYASNKKTFGDENWRYVRRPEGLDRFALEHRVVLEHIGGTTHGFGSSRFSGLSESAFSFIQDLITVAGNIGFDVENTASVCSIEWKPNKPGVFLFWDHVCNKEVELMEVRAFKKGNLHVKFNERFIHKLNVEFGRLKGWVKHHREAANEMNLNANVAAEAFGSNMQLAPSNILRLN